MSKFKIPSIPATTNKSIRFPNDVIEQVEKAIVGKDCTFSAFVIEAVRMVGNDAVLGVQFHPEYLAPGSSFAARLFRYFVDQARSV